MQFTDFNLSSLRDFPPQRNFYRTPRVTINNKGDISMNAELLHQTENIRDFRGQYSEDGCWLVLFQDQKPNIHFSKAGGKAKNAALMKILQDKGFSFPLVYAFERRDDLNAWVGRCLEMSPPPDITAADKPKRWNRRSV